MSITLINPGIPLFFMTFYASKDKKNSTLRLKERRVNGAFLTKEII